LTVGDDERAESPQSVKRLVAMLLGSVLVNWCARESGIATSDLLSLPDEILQEISIVLHQKESLGFLNHITEISDKESALLRELRRWVGECSGGESGVERNVDLSILRLMLITTTCTIKDVCITY